MCPLVEMEIYGLMSITEELLDIEDIFLWR